MEKETSEDLNELFGALSKAQGQITGAMKDAKNPFFKSNYTTLDGCWDCARKPLSDNGLSVIQTFVENDGKIYLKTILGHASGQFISSKAVFNLTKNDPQTFGSVSTYLRRYSFCAIVGITSGNDDDGEHAMQSYREHVNQSPKVEPAIPKVESAPPMGVDEFVDLLRKKTQNSYDFRFMDKYLSELEQTSGVKPIKVMMQALLPSNTERFCNSWQKWYLELSQETDRS